MNHTLKSFTDQVHKMRLAQERYFELAAKAKKTNHPDDHKARKNTLIMAKEMEKRVDAAIQEIIKELPTPDPLPAGIQGEFVVKDLEDKPL